MRQWLLVSSMALALGCNGQRRPGGDTLHPTDEDQLEPATCQDLWEHDNGCMDDAGCGNAFNETQFVNACKADHKTAGELAIAATLPCEDVMGDLCTHNHALSVLSCCAPQFECAGGLICDPIDSDLGTCMKPDSSAPDGAESCDIDNGDADCDAMGYGCLDGAGGAKCVQVCAP